MEHSGNALLRHIVSKSPNPMTSCSRAMVFCLLVSMCGGHTSPRISGVLRRVGSRVHNERGCGGCTKQIAE